MTLTLPRLSQRGAISLFLLGALSFGAATSLAAQDLREQSVADGFVSRYQRTEDWAVRAVQWLSLGERTTRSVDSLLVEAFQDKDRHLRVYALEGLAGLEDEILVYLPDAVLAEELLAKQTKDKSERYLQRLGEVLERMFPDAAPAEMDAADGGLSPRDLAKAWQKWWRGEKKTWQPKPWPGDLEVEEQRGQETVAGGFVSRAMDLSRSGLEVALVIDSTGSMQMTINGRGRHSTTWL